MNLSLAVNSLSSAYVKWPFTNTEDFATSWRGSSLNHYGVSSLVALGSLPPRELDNSINRSSSRIDHFHRFWIHQLCNNSGNSRKSCRFCSRFRTSGTLIYGFATFGTWVERIDGLPPGRWALVVGAHRVGDCLVRRGRVRSIREIHLGRPL